MNNRKIVQISTEMMPSRDGVLVYALCDDGTLWMRPSIPGGHWTRLDGVPYDVAANR